MSIENLSTIHSVNCRINMEFDLSLHRKKAKFPALIPLFLVLQFVSISCTVWPILTELAVPSNSSGGNGNESIVLLLLLQNDKNSSTNTGSTTTSSPTGPSASSCANNGGCSIFLSTATMGNFGGVSGADAKCVADAPGAGAPGSPSEYKALIMADDGSRTLTNNWVLWPNTVYKSMSNSGLTISTTDANAMFTFPLSNLFVPSGGNAMYTGIDASGATWIPKTGVTCTNAGVSWSSTSNLVSGWVGVTSGSDKTLVDVGGGTGFTCDNFLLIYCVQR